MTNNSYCPLPWIHRFVLPSGKEIPCCSYQEKNNFTSFDEIKKEMLNGVKVIGCSNCYEKEAAGIKSLRQVSIEKYAESTLDFISSLEVAFDNICNFKCRSCSSLHSHLIRSDEISIMGIPLLDRKFLTHDYYDKIDYKNLKEFKAHGGEPLISPNFKIFCDRILKVDNVFDLIATITTNGSTIPSESVYEFIKSVKKLTINISIDGFGELNEYIRSLSVWKDILSNLKFFENLYEIRGEKDTVINIHTAVSCYNVNKLKELDDYIKENFPRFTLSKDCIQHPEILSIRNLPAEYKEEILSSLSNYPEIKKFLLKQPNHPFDYFVFIHEEVDKLRKTSLKFKNDLFLNFIEKYKISSYDHDTALKYHNLSKNIMLKKDW